MLRAASSHWLILRNTLISAREKKFNKMRDIKRGENWMICGSEINSTEDSTNMSLCTINCGSGYQRTSRSLVVTSVHKACNRDEVSV